MDELFTIIGRLYIDLVQSQKVIDNLQKKINDQEKELSTIQKSFNLKDND
jgi:hypothetical protein